MLKLLAGFAALSLISGALMCLLPEGSLRHAASMAVGLLMLLYWSQGLQEMLSLPMTTSVPATLLVPTGISIEQAESDLISEDTP